MVLFQSVKVIMQIVPNKKKERVGDQASPHAYNSSVEGIMEES